MTLSASSRPDHPCAAATPEASGAAAERQHRSELEARLLEQAETHRALVEASAEIVWRTGPDGSATEPSPTWQAFTGQSTSEWLGLGWLGVVHPDDRDRLRRFWVEGLTEKKTHSIEYRLRHHSGQWRWIQERAVPLLTATGDLRGWVGMSVDIDLRRRADDALRTSEAHKRALIEAMSVLTWSAGSDGILAEGTADQWCEFTGQSLDDWNGRRWLDVVHPDDRELVRQRWSMQGQLQQTFEFEYRLWHSSGEWRWVLEKTVPVFDDGTRQCVGWVGMSSDISRQRRSELSHQESEARLRALVEATSQIVWTAEADGTYTEDSPSWRAFTGCSKAAWLAGGWIRDIHPDDAPTAAREWHATLRDGKPATFEYRLRHRSGDWRHVIERMVPLFDSDGRVRNWVGMASDVTDRKRLELSTVESEQRFRALVEASSQTVWTAEADGSIVEDSPSWRAFTGCTKDEWLDGRWSEYIHPDDAPTAAERWRNTVAQDKPVSAEYRIRHHSGDWRYILESIIPLRRQDSSVRGWVAMANDVTNQRLADLALKAQERLLRQALKAAQMVAWTWDLSSDGLSLSGLGAEMLEIDAAEEGMSAVLARMAPADAAALTGAANVSAQTGQPFELPLRINRRDGTRRWLNASGQAEAVASERRDKCAVRVRGVFRDVTASKSAEERRDLLVGEIAHRGKNLLAVVQSIAGITINDSRPVPESRQIFLDRLASLARSHTMLTQQDWEGVPLDEIVRMELANHSDRAEIDVDAVSLNPSSAQNVALVLHELATNAAKHGALSTPSGSVRVHGTLRRDENGSAVRFTWQECNGPAVKPPTRRGFGTMLLRRLVQGFDTEGIIDYRPDGLYIQVDMPLTMITPNHAQLTEAARAVH